MTREKTLEIQIFDFPYELTYLKDVRPEKKWKKCVNVMTKFMSWKYQSKTLILLNQYQQFLAYTQSFF